MPPCQVLADELSRPDPNIRVIRQAASERAVGSPPRSLSQSKTHLELILDAGLSVFTVHFDYPKRMVAEADRLRIDYLKTEVGPSLRVESPLSLFGLACLEISVAAAGGLPWRTCALDTCSAVFQPSRQDQIFHDKLCARAQASREWRSREKLKKGR